MDIGGDLRRARNARQLSLTDISHRTKINSSLLRAIEDNRFDRVPPGLFTRGYLRAYAREVQLDPEVLVERYRAEFETPVVAAVELRAEPASDADDGDRPIVFESSGRMRQLAGLAVVLLISAAYFGFAHRVAPPQLDSVAPTDKLEPSASAPTSTTGTVSTAQTAPIKLNIHAIGDCWVVATIDGERLFAHLMRSGDRQQFEIRHEAALRIGDPGAFTFTLDGIAGRTIGAPGTPVDVKLNHQNFKTFLR